jgi:quercetin dioxygenase-like cupin family protein
MFQSAHLHFVPVLTKVSGQSLSVCRFEGVVSMTFRLISSAALAVLMMSASPTLAETDDKGFVITKPEEMKWVQFAGVGSTSVAALEGDGGKPGVYVVRVKFPPNLFSRPHAHKEDRHITVLKGTWYMGKGPDFDPSKAVAVPAGSYVKHPAGEVHWDGSKDEEVILHIVGVGPGSTNWVSKDTPNFGPAK